MRYQNRQLQIRALGHAQCVLLVVAWATPDVTETPAAAVAGKDLLRVPSGPEGSAGGA